MSSSQTRPLSGKKIAVLIESLYIPEEIQAYKDDFTGLGAEVDFLSRLWDRPSLPIVSDPNGFDEKGAPRLAQSMVVELDFERATLEDYAAIIMSANYPSVRLRYFEPPQQPADAPAVVFFARAMSNPRIIKGALCHGLWILTPRPDLLKDRRVICHEVVRADILNAGAVFTPSDTNVVRDRDLVTGHSKDDVHHFVAAIAEAIVDINST